MTRALVQESKQLGLTIKENKTKCMILQYSLQVEEDMEFERVDNFKYLYVEINSQGKNYKKIRIIINASLP